MTKIKICGITNYEDALNAANLGADYIGFNFYMSSPRCIKRTEARSIIKRLPKNAKSVGVFVNEEISLISKTVDFCKLEIIQLSGDEDNKFVFNLKNKLNNPIIKSFKAEKNQKKFSENFFADYIMLDSFKNELYGGTGLKFDWRIAKFADNRRLFLAGGLNSINVKSAIRMINPYAVDVCSSIESCPGKKDAKKMKEFIEAVK